MVKYIIFIFIQLLDLSISLICVCGTQTVYNRSLCITEEDLQSLDIP